MKYIIQNKNGEISIQWYDNQIDYEWIVEGYYTSMEDAISKIRIIAPNQTEIEITTCTTETLAL